MKRTLYCYYLETVNNNRIALGQKPLFKIGDTTIEANSPEEAADQRIAQQDSTSNFEPLKRAFAVEVPEDFMPGVEHIDKKFHKWLRKTKSIYKYRKDADREWFGDFNNAREVKEYINEFIFGVHAENNWPMRHHQQEAHDKIVKYFTENYGEFLLAAKMRFGKNFTFLNVVKTLGYKNVLVLTYKPGVFDSLQEDIENHIYFGNFQYISYKDTRENLVLSSDKVNIVACSAQMAGYKYDEENDAGYKYDEENDEESFDNFNQKNLDILTQYKWDLIVTDACHYGTSTMNFKKIYESLKCSKILYISGTPFKTLANYKENQLYMYTYIDEQNTPGNTMAKLHQYGIKMDQRLIDSYKKYKEIVDYPTMTKIFNADDNGNFETPEIAKPFIDYIITKGINSVNGNIRHMFALLDHKNSVKAIVKYINENYSDKFVAIDGSNEIVSVDKLKECIHDAVSANKKSITFSCGRFVEGVSVKEWNCVLMLHDGNSPERYFQAMFRGQTPVDWKTDFYVIDYNPERMLCMNHFIIDEIPTGEKSITHNTKQDNSREWLKACEIIVIDNDSDQTQKEISYKDIENIYFHNDGIGANMMSDSSVLNRIQFINIGNDDLNYIMSFKGKSQVPNKDVIVNDNGLAGGKNKVKSTNTGKNSNVNNKKNKSNKEFTISELIAFAKDITKLLPRYILAYDCKNLNDIIESCVKNEDENKESFFEYIGQDFEILNMINNANVINEDGINNVINKFWDELYEVRNMDALANNSFNIRWNIYK